MSDQKVSMAKAKSALKRYMALQKSKGISIKIVKQPYRTEATIRCLAMLDGAETRLFYWAKPKSSSLTGEKLLPGRWRKA